MKHLLFFLLLISTTLHSQTRYPFGSKHKNIKTITLTNGKYDEFFDEDTLQRVGSSVININTKKITKIKLSQEEIDELENKQASRFLSIDPLTSKFSYLTPYQYASNTPIQAIDLDGLEKYLVIWDEPYSGKTTRIRIFSFVDANGNAKDNNLKKVVDGNEIKIVTNGDEYYSDDTHRSGGGECYSQTELDPDTKFIYENAKKNTTKNFTDENNNPVDELNMVQKTANWKVKKNGYFGEKRKNTEYSIQTQSGFKATGDIFTKSKSGAAGISDFDYYMTDLNSKSGNTTTDQNILVTITTTNANKNSAEKLQKEIIDKYKNAKVNINYDDKYKSKGDKKNKSSATDLKIEATVLDTK